MLLQTQNAAERFEALRGGLDIPLAERLIGVVGIAVMIGLAVLMSYDRKRINWRLVASEIVATRDPFVVLRTSGSAPRLPMRVALFRLRLTRTSRVRKSYA